MPPSRHAVRMGVRDRCASGRTRPGRHDRREPHPVLDPRARIRLDRRAGASRIYQEHGVRCRGLRRGPGGDRRPGRRARTIAAPRLSFAFAGCPTDRRGSHKDGHGALRRGPVRRDRARVPRLPGCIWCGSVARCPGFGPRGGQPAPPLDQYGMVRGPDSDRGARSVRSTAAAGRSAASYPGSRCLSVRSPSDHCGAHRKRTDPGRRHGPIFTLQPRGQGREYRGLGDRRASDRGHGGSTGRHHADRAGFR